MRNRGHVPGGRSGVKRHGGGGGGGGVPHRFMLSVVLRFGNQTLENGAVGESPCALHV